MSSYVENTSVIVLDDIVQTENITYSIKDVDNCNVSGNGSSVFNMSSYEVVELPVYVFAYVTAISALVFMLGVLGNVMVIAVICQIRAMRNSTNYFLFSLSIADLCVLLVCQPVAIMDFYAKERWFIGEVMCKVFEIVYASCI